jgi:hypothetical protein
VRFYLSTSLGKEKYAGWLDCGCKLGKACADTTDWKWMVMVQIDISESVHVGSTQESDSVNLELVQAAFVA